MLEAALSTSPDVTRLLVGGPRAPPDACVESPPAIAELPSRALCIAISHDRGDESFADDLNMGRGIVSGRVALLLRSTEIRPHRPNDLLPPSNSQTPGCYPPYCTWCFHTWPKKIPFLGLHSGVPPQPALPPRTWDWEPTKPWDRESSKWGLGEWEGGSGSGRGVRRRDWEGERQGQGVGVGGSWLREREKEWEWEGEGEGVGEGEGEGGGGGGGEGGGGGRGRRRRDGEGEGEGGGVGVGGSGVGEREREREWEWEREREREWEGVG